MALDRPLIANHAVLEGYKTEVYVYLSPNQEEPSDEVLEVAVAGAAKAAVSIPIADALTNKIYAGQSLVFYNSTTGVEVLATLTDDAEVAATSLDVKPLVQAIAAGATAELPAYVWDRTAADLDRQATFSATAGYNDSRTSQVGVITGGNATFTVPGRYHQENAGARTLEYAYYNGLKVFIKRALPNPNSSVYSAGLIQEFFAYVTAAPQASPNEGNVSNDFTLQVIGEIKETDPAAVPDPD